MPQLRFVLYVSQIATDLALADVRGLTGVARMLNRRKDLSGLLVFTGRHFLQILEGEKETLNSTLASIRADPRHRAIVEILDEPLRCRNFEGWDMGLINSPDWDDRIAGLHATLSLSDAQAMLTMLMGHAANRRGGSNSLFMDPL